MSWWTKPTVNWKQSDLDSCSDTSFSFAAKRLRPPAQALPRNRGYPGSANARIEIQPQRGCVPPRERHDRAKSAATALRLIKFLALNYPG